MQDEPDGPCGGLYKAMCSYPMQCVGGSAWKEGKVCVRPCEKCAGQDKPGFHGSMGPVCCSSGHTCMEVDMKAKRVSQTTTQTSPTRPVVRCASAA